MLLFFLSSKFIDSPLSTFTAQIHSLYISWVLPFFFKCCTHLHHVWWDDDISVTSKKMMSGGCYADILIPLCSTFSVWLCSIFNTCSSSSVSSLNVKNSSEGMCWYRPIFKINDISCCWFLPCYNQFTTREHLPTGLPSLCNKGRTMSNMTAGGKHSSMCCLFTENYYYYLYSQGVETCWANVPVQMHVWLWHEHVSGVVCVYV